MAYEQEIKQAVFDLAKFLKCLARISPKAVMARVENGEVVVTIDYRKTDDGYSSGPEESAKKMVGVMTRSRASNFRIHVTNHQVLWERDNTPYNVKMPEITLYIPDTIDSLTQLRGIIKHAVIDEAENGFFGPLPKLKNLVGRLDGLPPQQAEQIRHELLTRVEKILGTGRDKPAKAQTHPAQTSGSPSR
jgi:hypothetical protein